MAGEGDPGTRVLEQAPGHGDEGVVDLEMQAHADHREHERLLGQAIVGAQSALGARQQVEARMLGEQEARIDALADHARALVVAGLVPQAEIVHVGQRQAAGGGIHHQIGVLGQHLGHQVAAAERQDHLGLVVEQLTKTGAHRPGVEAVAGRLEEIIRPALEADGGAAADLAQHIGAEQRHDAAGRGVEIFLGAQDQHLLAEIVGQRAREAERAAGRRVAGVDELLGHHHHPAGPGARPRARRELGVIEAGDAAHHAREQGAQMVAVDRLGDQIARQIGAAEEQPGKRIERAHLLGQGQVGEQRRLDRAAQVGRVAPAQTQQRIGQRAQERHAHPAPLGQDRAQLLHLLRGLVAKGGERPGQGIGAVGQRIPVFRARRRLARDQLLKKRGHGRHRGQAFLWIGRRGTR
ncbi:hypothetical protein CKO24_09320 [Rhodothalassium salexigens DSM 2132]|nr:hypothetical protein [Rhodothalassium salexigens DSM 2132]